MDLRPLPFESLSQEKISDLEQFAELRSPLNAKSIVTNKSPQRLRLRKQKKSGSSKSNLRRYLFEICDQSINLLDGLRKPTVKNLSKLELSLQKTILAVQEKKRSLITKHHHKFKQTKRRTKKIRSKKQK